MEQQIALGVTLSLLGLIALIFSLVIRRSSTATADPGLQERSYRLRSRLLVIAALVALPIMLLTLSDMPYAKASATREPLQVSAVGRQWHWSIEPSIVPVGTPVVFNVTSDDVNHGFGIYDAQMRLIAQTQAMPGYVNRLTHTFEEAGTYKVLCMEYCGSAHHVMAAEITVAAAAKE